MSLKERLRSSSMASRDTNNTDDDDDSRFTLALMQALQQECVVKQLQMALKQVVAPLEEALKQSNDINAALRRQIAERDATIGNLTQQVAELTVRYDDLEQQGRKGSIRVFGLPEDDGGTLETKLLKLMNENMQLDPPINPEEIEVAHRLGKPPPKPRQPQTDGQGTTSNDAVTDAPETDAASPAPATPLGPRAVIVKLMSRRTKTRIMDARYNLKDNPYQKQDGTTSAVYISDDLTKRRANLAFQARKLKRDKRILDTWVTNCKVLVKENYGRITLITSIEDLQKYTRGNWV